MRLYIRNKVKYDPSNAGKPLVFVDFPDPRVFSVGQVKEVRLHKCMLRSFGLFQLLSSQKQLNCSSVNISKLKHHQISISLVAKTKQKLFTPYRT